MRGLLKNAHLHRPTIAFKIQIRYQIIMPHTTPAPLSKKAFIRTYGCQMNEQDSAQMESLLTQCGYSRAQDPFEADLILINTCSVREKAVHKIYSDLGRMRPLKLDKPALIVGIAGCVAEQEKSRLSDRFPFVDFIFGPDHIRRLPQMLAKVESERQGGQKPASQVFTGFDLRQDFQFMNVLPAAEENPVKAFVNIQKGCDNICSFCIVPFVRGREVSRPHGDIVDEIKKLVDRGVKEVTLLGQNVNSYGLKSTGDVTFARLLELIAEKTKLKRLRFTTSHPKDVKDDLIVQFRDNPILAPLFHLPVQSGSTRILEQMRRQYTRAEYLDIITKLQSGVPQIHFSTDIIVGFPGETEAEFKETLGLVEQVQFDQVFSFVYSSRPYTKAAKLSDDVGYPEKLERLKVLQDFCKKIAIEQNRRDVGTLQNVLLEVCDESQERPCMGRTPANKIVHFIGQDHQAGEFVTVRITQANAFSLVGETEDSGDGKALAV